MSKQKDTVAVENEVKKLEGELAAAQDQIKRAHADYQNLVRRTQEDRVRWAKLASREVVEALLEPYQNLQLAAGQLQNQGLQMVIQQFDQAFAEFGLAPIAQVGQDYNPNLMEAIPGSVEGGQKVNSVQIQGYTLNGEVIRPAKVVVA